jgi:tetratricopeptide (TPR) repeat protein
VNKYLGGLIYPVPNVYFCRNEARCATRANAGELKFNTFNMRILPVLIGIFSLAWLLTGASPSFAQKKEKKEGKQQESDKRQEEADNELNQQLMEELAELDRVNSEYQFTEGMQHYLLADYPKAIKAFEVCLKLAPENAAIHYQIGQCYYKQGKYPEALKYGEAALQRSKTNKYYYLLVAEVYQRQEKFAEAEQTYLAMLANVTGANDYYYDLANVLFMQGKYREVIKIYEEWEKKEWPDKNLIMRKQKLYLTLNNLDGAIKEGQKLIDANPDDPEYYLLLVELMLRNDRKDEAQKMLDALAQRFPNEPRIRLLKSEMLGSEGNLASQLSEMEAAFANPALGLEDRVKMLANFFEGMKTPEEKAVGLRLAELTVKLFPDDGQVQGLYGAYLSENGKTREARDAYLKALKEDGNNFQLWAGVVQLDLQLRDYQGLAKHTEEALEFFPNQAAFWFYNGTAHYLNRRYEEAVEALEQGKLYAAGNTEMLYQIQAQLGDSFNALKQHDRSDQAYEEALKHKPDDRIVLNNWSYYLSLRKQRLDKAKEMSARLVQWEPNNSTYLDTHGWVLYIAGDYKNALVYLERAAKNTESGTILEHYGDVLFKLGQVEEAFVQWQRAKKSGSGLTQFIDRKIAEKKLYE